ncbi:phage tail tube protein [Halomonas getboli]|uniref:phage tail tube protein n=1 Tax=Halomonas getboli TaxID=2935862 RepID=UPI001FFF4AEA|nr:phage tail tube protein [Halomonas getboli]MCK2183505.1 hypothetical protein [Halomonas getboli]
MSKLAQGTELFFIDKSSSTDAITKIECATTHNPGGNPASRLDDTCLESNDMEYKAGLRDPAEASIGVRPDPDMDSHYAMFLMSQMSPSPNTTLLVGWSDGPKDADGKPATSGHPTLDSNGEVDLPTNRTWLQYDGYFADFSFDFQTNALVSGTVPFQRSGKLKWQRKSA